MLNAFSFSIGLLSLQVGVAEDGQASERAQKMNRPACRVRRVVGAAETSIEFEKIHFSSCCRQPPSAFIVAKPKIQPVAPFSSWDALPSSSIDDERRQC